MPAPAPHANRLVPQIPGPKTLIHRLWPLGLSVGLLLGGCTEPLDGRIAGHTLGNADTAFFEVIDDDTLSGIGLVIADSPFECEALRTILNGGGDPVALDNGRQVAFIHLQFVQTSGSPIPSRGTLPIVTNTTALNGDTPIALAQVRLRQGNGYGLISQLIAEDGEVSFTYRDDALNGNLRLETREGDITGGIAASPCPSLGGAIN